MLQTNRQTDRQTFCGSVDEMLETNRQTDRLILGFRWLRVVKGGYEWLRETFYSKRGQMLQTYRQTPHWHYI